jgi:DNA primase
MDGDEAGRKAAQILKPIIEELEFIVEIIKLPDDTDPGELDQIDVQSIAEYIKK